MYPISIACFDKDVWIRISGRGNFKCSGTLKKLVQEMVDKKYYRYILDLKKCEQLDSTFMGTMAGIAQRLRQHPQSIFKTVNASKSNQELLENLGLDQLFSIQSLAVKEEFPPSSDETCFSETSFSIPMAEEKANLQEVIVSAHEALVVVNQGNAEKFKNVVEICTKH